MSDRDFNFDEFFDGINEDTKNTRATSTTSNTSNTSRLHPFSARLDEGYIRLIKALAWWRRISQREPIEEAIDLLVSEMDKEELHNMLEKYGDE